MSHRTLSVTIDTEIDKSRDWSISSAATFRSVLHGIPLRLTPLFERHGVKPTYLLSPEVIEEPACATVIAAAADRAELGTHLHVDLIEPDRRVHRGDLAGRRADGIQAQLEPSTEGQKLANLTALFESTFGHRPRAFRAGRFGRSVHTIRLLAELGYVVDSSVTPGLRWRYADGIVDYRKETTVPYWVECAGRRILEAPVSIWPASRLAPLLHALPLWGERIGRRLVPPWGSYLWLRPSWGPPGRLADLARRAPDQHLVVMFHSTEVVPGASPYARTQRDADLVVERLDRLLGAWVREGEDFCTLSELAERCNGEPVPVQRLGGIE